MIGVAADDITGANDIGIMFAKHGFNTHVYSFAAGAPLALGGGKKPDAVILDTDSRFDGPEKAYRKVFEATLQLRAAGCSRFYNKTCSVFRGNIGAEFDAMLDALGESFAVVVLGFPKNGRTTVDGIHYVHGNKLEHSEFRNDPVHPMTRSDLAGILQAQTKRRVATIAHRIVSQGAGRLAEELDGMKRSGVGYVIVDVVDQPSLATIAKAVEGIRVLCGSSALAEELSALERRVGEQEVGAFPVAPLLGMGVLCVAGSLMPQTAEQLKVLEKSGIPSIEIDSLLLLDAQSREAEIRKLATACSIRIASGSDVALHTPNRQEAVDRTKQAGAALGLSNVEVSRLVSGAVAEITGRVLQVTGLSRVVIAGGDTSAAVCAKLGVKGMRLWQEIEPGLPSCITFTDPPLLMVLKSGSFGKPDFLAKALEHLKQQS
ncbi:hypothetical protein SD70_26495 [Gordoniibacillus kamchatkensis]|uniref:Four-carbon acid sugar kinase family protein n=1 Tax=Gordoniibacillus kamchatkensis TaxID=1590651 RepID=A0ABR5ABL1_9BACL|nr:four-carbon acid sugar kinase family protein [Paenibacillus sp. VKM B-2647]KIL38413.1 hypothetical protein SD70_26495 [Paenibacillus sp. VKM B-2647]